MTPSAILMATNCPIPAALEESRTTVIRFKTGAHSLKSSSHRILSTHFFPSSSRLSEAIVIEVNFLFAGKLSNSVLAAGDLLTHIKARRSLVVLKLPKHPIKPEGNHLERLSTTTTGLVVGAVMGGMHLFWSLMVAAGWGQSIMNFIFWMYFIKPIDLIEPFELIRAISLVVTTSIIGFMLGWTAARLWNWLRMIAAFEAEPVHRITRCL